MFCKIVAPSSDIHKLADVPKSFQDLRDVVIRKFKHEIPNKFVLKYKDSEEELITLCNDEDLVTAVQTHQAEQIKTLRIFVILDNKPDTNTEKKPEPKQIQAPSQESNNLQGKAQNQSPPSKKDKFAPDAYGGNPEYAPADSGKVFEENADPRRIYEQLPLPQMLDLRRSVSHNPQLDFERAGININNLRNFDTNDLMDKVPFRMASPNIPEQMIMSEYFNDNQIKAIVGLVEQKVKEKIEEKLQSVSGAQDDSRVFARGNNGFPQKSMGTPFGSRMFSRRNTNIMEEPQDKNCSVCGEQINGIRYNCLNCKNFECCEKCESSTEHPHPLLKIRPSKGIDGLKQDISTLVDDQFPPILEFGSRNSSKTMFQRTSSVVETSSQANVLEPVAASSTTIQKKGQINTPNTNNNGGAGAGAGILKRTGTNPAISNNNSQTPNQFNIYEFGMTESQTIKGKTPMSYAPTHNTPNTQQQTQQTPQTKQYKVALIKPPLYEVTTVRAGMPYNISFTIKNNGDAAWPDETKLICVEGNHKGEEIQLPSLRQGQNYMVDLHLDAPSDYGRYFNEWKVHYPQNGAPKAFGKEIMIEIEVIQGDKQDKERAKRDKEKNEKDKNTSEKSAISEEDQKLMKEYNCSEQVLKHAKVIQDLMCSGTLKEKVDFMKECAKDWDLNQIVSAYLTWINNPNKLKNMTQSTPTLNE